jgi:Fanconi anemia group M protein
MGPDRTKTDASFVKDPLVQRAYRAAKRWKGASHPKVEPLLRVVSTQVKAKPGSKVIVFAELRDTVDFLVGLLRSEGLRAERFTGQGTRRGRKGMAQKQQAETLSRFARGAFEVLCATSIAEEGLDVPQVDLVVFYEPVASDVRLIQRKGRTGRDAPGRVIILTTDRMADEGYLWAGMKREKRMRRLVKRMAREAADEVEPPSEEPPEVTVERPSKARSDQRKLTDY